MVSCRCFCCQGLFFSSCCCGFSEPGREQEARLVPGRCREAYPVKKRDKCFFFFPFFWDVAKGTARQEGSLFSSFVPRFSRRTGKTFVIFFKM